MWQVGGRRGGGVEKEAFYRSLLEIFGGGYLIFPIFYENEKEMVMGNFWRKKGAMNVVMERGVEAFTSKRGWVFIINKERKKLPIENEKETKKRKGVGM